MSDALWQCQMTDGGYIYDPARGDTKEHSAPGTCFEDLPDDWRCPLCGASKKMFKKLV